MKTNPRIVLLAAGLLPGLLLFSVALAQTSSASVNMSAGSSINSSARLNQPTGGATTKSTNNSSNFQTNGMVGSSANSFNTNGNLSTNSSSGSSSVTSDLMSDFNLANGPSMSGPDSIGWCTKRSTCGVEADQCAADCKTNTLVTSASQTQAVGNPTLDGSRAFASDNCTAACQNTYDACSAAQSRLCELSQ